MAADITVTNDGSVWLFEAHTAEAERWIADRFFPPVKLDGVWIVDHRYAPPIVEAMREEEFTLAYEDGPGNPFRKGGEDAQ